MSASPEFVRLPSGAWINPAFVVQVSAYQQVTSSGEPDTWKVVLLFSDGSGRTAAVRLTRDQAVALADQYAELLAPGRSRRPAWSATASDHEPRAFFRAARAPDPEEPAR